MEKFFVYIIYSPHLNKYYVRYTIDLTKRLQEHNSGLSHFTSKYNDWELKYFREMNTRSEAMAEEKRIKLKKSRKYIEWLISSAG